MWLLVLAQLAEWLALTPEDPGLNVVNSNFYATFFNQTV